MEITAPWNICQKQVLLVPNSVKAICWENAYKIPQNMSLRNFRTGCRRLIVSPQPFIPMHLGRFSLWRANSIPVSLEGSSVNSEDYGSNDEDKFTNLAEEILSKPLSSDELKSLIADSERERLTKKLSGANQNNRFLKRELLSKEEALANFRSELAAMELEIQALIKLAEEIARSDIPKGSRKIKGKYIQSHLLSRLEGVLEKIKEEIKDVGVVKCKEVQIFWSGMAESVQVMGSFDGWSQGEHLSPDYDGSFNHFSTTLMLRPGRYEIKFVVDEEWQLSPEFPTVGEGSMENNLLTVE